MVLKFDDVIYLNTFEIHAKDTVLDVNVSITDKESEKLTELMLDVVKGQGNDEAINNLLFKDQLPQLKEILIGFNFTKFQKLVIGDFTNFIKGSIDESMKNLKVH